MFDLKQRRIELGLTMLEVAKLVGVSEATISRYESGNIKNMRKDRIAKYASALKVPPSTFLELEDKSESRLTASDIRANTKPVPLVGRVAAGLSCHAEDNIEGYILTDCELLHEGYDYFWLTVKGDSMEPELHDGDRVLVREQETLETECYAVVRIDGEDGVVKRVRIDRDRITLTSVNPYYPPRVFEHEQMNDVAVVGKVIQSQRSY
ncbi:MAG: XRE family transcriptional regulator [Ruminococcus sp.]|nr:XRE family transcriptional regulator [Ruminococcus sp.]